MRETVEANVRALAIRMPELVSQYLGKDSWAHLFATVATLFVGVYESFQREFGKEVEPLLIRVTRGMKHLTDDMVKKYKLVHEEADQKLCDAIRNARLNSSRVLRDNAKKQQQLEGLLVDQTKDLDRIKVALVGHERTHIAIPNLERNTFIVNLGMGLAIVVIVMGIEYLTGFGMWKYMSDQDMATGLSIITVLGLTTLTHFMVKAMRRYIGWKDAMKNFGRMYPEGHPAKYLVEHFPTGDKMMALGGLALLVALSLTLLLSRWWIVAQQGSDFSGIAGAVGLLAVIMVYALIEFYLEEPYTHEQYLRLAQAQTAYDKTKSEIASLKAYQATYEDDVQHAVDTYNEALDDAETSIRDQVKGLERDRKTLVEKLVEYGQIWALLQAEFKSYINALIQEIRDTWRPVAKEVPAGTDAANAKILALFTGKVQREYNDQKLLLEIQQYRFTGVELPQNIRHIDFEKVAREAVQELNVPQVG